MDAAQEKFDTARDTAKGDAHIRFELPDPGLSSSRKIAELTWGNGEHHIIQGPDRCAIVGRNGVGKTTLIRRLLASVGTAANPAAIPGPSAVTGRLLTDKVGYLPQGHDGIPDGLTALEALRAAAPDATATQLRGALGALLIQGDDVHRPIRDLSGGERFRVGLARLIFTEPTPELLILDEPTNHLDIASVTQLTDALRAYRGALIIVSHDDMFLDELGLDARLEITEDRLNVHMKEA